MIKDAHELKSKLYEKYENMFNKQKFFINILYIHLELYNRYTKFIKALRAYN